MDRLDNFQIPKLPSLKGGCIIVPEQAWNMLTDYVNAQTSTINALTEAVNSLAKLHDIQTGSTNKQIKNLNDEVAEIAQALEGAYTDE